MTTLATDGKVLAADGLITGNGIKHMTDCRKVFRLDSGAVVGFCGTVYVYADALAYLNGTSDNLDVGDEFEALILHPNGRCECMDGKGRRYDQSTPAAGGSGSAVALGAMLAGASPSEAVKIAAKLDTGTGGKVRIEEPRK